MFRTVAFLLLFAAGAASAQGTAPWDKYADRITASQDIPKLGDDMFGDSVALMNGGLSFSATDVSLPGPGPAIALGRNYTVQNWRYRAPSEIFGDWEADVPKISGIYLGDWVDSNGGTERCSTGGPPAQHASKGVVARDYWQGLHLNLPGGGGGELLGNLDLSAAKNPTQLTGHPFYYVTNDHVRITCLNTIKNGTGQGFVAITPDGTKYYFDWLAKHAEAPLRRGTTLFYDYTPGANGGNGIWIPREYSIPSARNVLYATRVVDRFGNVVSYEYDAAYPARLKRIVSGDLVNNVVIGGDGRAITIDYTSGWASAVHDGTGRTWTYAYANTPENRRTLTTVIRPSTDRWTIAFSQFTDAELEYDETPDYGERSCQLEQVPQNEADTPTGTITHPSGAIGTFTTAIERHSRTNVPLGCVNVTSGPGGNDVTDDVPLVPVSHDQFSITSKTIAGPLLPTATWTYAYASNRWWINPNGGQFQNPYVCANTFEFCTRKPTTCTTLCNSVATTLVVGPGSRWTRYSHGNHYRQNEGKLVKVETGSGTGPSSTLLYGRPNNVLNEKINTYLIAANGTCAIQWGSSIRYGDAYTNECPMPMTESVTWRQGVNFRWKMDTWNEYAMPTQEVRSSGKATGSGIDTPANSRTDTTTYLNDTPKWVLGLVTSRRNANLDWITEKTAYHSVSRQPLVRYWPHAGSDAAPVALQTLAWNPIGTLASVKDGRNKETRLSDWYRGVPRRIDYPDATYESAQVDTRGQILSFRGQAGFTTTYQYDTRGMIARIIHPAATPAWNDTTREFGKTSGVVLGFPAGTWRQIVRTGTGESTTYFDAMWRPVISHEQDTAVAGTSRYNAWEYDADGNTVFTAYPLAAATSRSSFANGVHTTYDALDRPTAVAQDNGAAPAIVTLTEYLDGFRTKVTNPLGRQTTTRYQAFDEPDTGAPIQIDAPEGQRTVISRNILGLATTMTRSGTLPGQVETATRRYGYDEQLRLCQLTEPETGSTVMHYDNAGNVLWSAAGLTLTHPTDPTTCQTNRTSAHASGRRVERTYDELNRLKTLAFPDYNGNQTWVYTPDGLPASITTLNNEGSTSVVNAYNYNSRRMLTGESSGIPGWYTWGIGYGYNANGHLASQSYPSGHAVAYAPNALGQATQAGSYATGVQYHPNGAVKQFTYGNGLVHSMVQNARLLPARSTDTGGALDHEYGYDANGNVLATVDHNDSIRSRWMSYDALDRLTAAGSVVFGGDHWHRFTYNELDNMTSWKLGGVKDYANYVYDTKNRLELIRNSAGAVVQNLQYDPSGNVIAKSGLGLNFDLGNRLRYTSVNEVYRYDGHGRRVLAWTPTGGSKLSMYSASGQVMYQHSDPKQSQFENIYLAGSLVAIRELPFAGGSAVKYQHTDALGSPVAVSDQAGGIERTNYDPYGGAINKSPPVDGVGYTGHVMDPHTGLTYMQQRYYDPAIGRFLSADPVAPSTANGTNFNRYWYANNNPYRFTDPDGRFSWAIFADAFKAEVSGGLTLEAKVKLGPLAEGSVGLGSMTGGVGASGTDAYSFIEASGPSAGITVLDKVQVGLTPTSGRTEFGRYDLPYREVSEKGSLDIGPIKGDAEGSSSGELSAEVGFVLGKAKISIDLGQAAYGLFVASPDEIPAQQEEAQVDWEEYKSSASWD